MLLLMRKLRHRGEAAFLCQNKSAEKQEVSLRALVPAQSPALPPLCLLTLPVPPCSCSFPEGLELPFDTLCAGAQGQQYWAEPALPPVPEQLFPALCRERGPGYLLAELLWIWSPWRMPWW